MLVVYGILLTDDKLIKIKLLREIMNKNRITKDPMILIILEWQTNKINFIKSKHHST